MLEGNRFLPETGIPMRKMACMSKPLALAEPVPLTLASFRAKSLTRISLRSGTMTSGSVSGCGKYGPSCVWNFEFKLLHVPRRRGATLRTQTAVDAKILVFEHQPLRLRQRSGSVNRLV